MSKLKKIGFGGGCHWCTEAVFLSLKGVDLVEQGWIASVDEAATFSEAVIVTYNEAVIPLEILIEIHLRTHKSTSAHSMRKKYRSAVYIFKAVEKIDVSLILKKLQLTFDKPLITQILLFRSFKPSQDEFVNYYYKNPQKPFCKTFINPKLSLLLTHFSDYTNSTDLKHL